MVCVCLHYPLLPPASQRQGPAPARHGRGEPMEGFPHPRPPATRRGPPGSRPLRAAGGGRERRRAPGPRPLPDPEGEGAGRGITHLAVKGFHGLHVAAEAGAGRLLSADGGRAGRGLASVCVCVCSSLRGRRASSPWRVAQGAGAEGRGPPLVSVYLSATRGLLAPFPARRRRRPLPRLGSARPRRQEMEEQGAAARAPIWRTHTGAPRSAAPRGAESGAGRLQRRLPGGPRPSARRAAPQRR